jgi:hypothetical protein
MERELATYENRFSCLQCGEPTAKRVPSAPNVLKASWPMGRTSAASQDLKEASRLRVEAASAPPEIKSQIEAEANRLSKLPRR